ncbi:MAG: rhomboid family intramembrane serine protease [Bacteroidales bacterium]|nr:rhomboid family intramembrane serine protease [Bacteroidales bacterium]
MIEQTNSKTELKKMLLAIVIPASFMFLAWLIFALEKSLNINFAQYGLLPRDFRQWYGILTMPFLHGGSEHIIANTVSFIILGSMLFYFHNDRAILLFILSYFLSGIFTWLIGRESIHIGASAMIYAFAGYLFTAGLIGKNIRRMAITLIIVFLYGSMIWGMFPINEKISWEGHLSGFITGLILAIIFTPPTESLPDDDDDFDENQYWLVDETQNKDKLLN